MTAIKGFWFVILLAAVSASASSCTVVTGSNAMYDPLWYSYVPGSVGYVPIYCPCPPDCGHHHEYGHLYPEHFDSDGRHVSSRGTASDGPRRRTLDRPEPVVTSTSTPRKPDVPVVEATPQPAPPPARTLPRPRPKVVPVTPKEEPKPQPAPPEKPSKPKVTPQVTPSKDDPKASKPSEDPKAKPAPQPKESDPR